jgi:hypothetical protein
LLLGFLCHRWHQEAEQQDEDLDMAQESHFWEAAQ